MVFAQPDHTHYMRHALALASQASGRPGTSPIACVIVLDDRVIGESVNQVGLRIDPTAHAEMVAIRHAAKALGRTDLQRATLYSTLQPCGMCTMASIWARIGHIVYGAGRAQVHRMYFEDRHLETVDFIRDAVRKDLTMQGGVLAECCAALLHGPDDQVPAAEQGNI